MENLKSLNEKLKKITSENDDFQDVKRNINILIEELFPLRVKQIHRAADVVSQKCNPLATENYWTFMMMVSNEEELVTLQNEMGMELEESQLKSAVFQLFFQIHIFQKRRFYDEILVISYLDEVQPLLDMQNL